MAVYRGIIAEWKETRRNAPEYLADAITLDILDLESHLSRMTLIWNQLGHAEPRTRRFVRTPQSGLKRKYEQRQK